MHLPPPTPIHPSKEKISAPQMRSKPWLDNWSPFDHTLFSFLSPPSPEFAIAANNTNPALVIVPNRTNHAVVDDSVSKVLQKVKRVSYGCRWNTASGRYVRTFSPWSDSEVYSERSNVSHRTFLKEELSGMGLLILIA